MSGTRMISGFQCWQTKINVAIANHMFDFEN